MDLLDSLLQDFAGYPRWLVALIGGFLAIIVVWVGAKLLKWTVYVVAAIVLVCVLGALALWWLAPEQTIESVGPTTVLPSR